jgi:putative ABC transport system permease protein
MLSLAWRGIKNDRKFTFLFALNLMLGLLGFCVLDSFKTAIDANLEQRSKLLLSADLSISVRRDFTPEEEKAIDALLPPGTQTGKLVVMYSMISSGQTSRLVELNAIDGTYPFYGQITLENGGTITSGSPRAILDTPVAWTYHDLGIQLGIQRGDTVHIGDEPFKIADWIGDDTGSAWRDVTLGPKVYIGMPFLEATHLLKRGSTAYRFRLFRLPDNVDPEKLSKKLDLALPDPAIQVNTHRKNSEEVGRLLDYLGDYLGLVALVALFLAGVGASYLLQSLFAQRTREVAILASLGVSYRRIRDTYLLQQAILGTAAAVAALAVASGILPILSRLLQGVLEAKLDLIPGPRTILLTLLIGGVGSALITFPLLLRLKALKPSLLFQESVTPRVNFSVWGILPVFTAYWGLAIWQAHSIKIGCLFMAGFLGSGAILGGLGAALLAVLRGRRSRPSTGVARRLAFRNLLRNPVASISCLVALGLGTLLLNLIPEIQGNIATEFTRPGGEETPDLFLWDIQEDQLESLKSLLKERNVPTIDFSPLVRARLDSVNGKAYEKVNESSKFKTREEERDARTRNRGFNLSYRAGLSSSETLWKGRTLRTTPPADGIGEVSVERRFAERMDIHLGDLLSFDVQGVPVQGRVVGLRQVRWTSFQPNFFVVFQPGILEEAPKTFIASIPKLGLDRKIKTQNELVAKFPNVSIVDLDQLVQKILQLFEEMGIAIQAMAYLCLVTGLIVLFSIANHQTNARGPEINLLKVLGTGFGVIRAMVRIEFATLAFAASIVGVALSYVLSYLISVVIFDGEWAWTWKFQAASIILVTLLGVTVSSWATAKVLRKKPLELLSESA